MKTAMEMFLARLPPESRVLIIGAGGMEEIRAVRAAGHKVAVVDYALDRKRFEDQAYVAHSADAVWMSHVLEHTRNPGAFLDKVFHVLRPGGVLGVVVPPLKHEIVGGHLSLWNAGLLLYHLIRAGFDCSKASVRSYDYNVAVIVKRWPAGYSAAELNEDNGDIETLAPFFPLPVAQGFDGQIDAVNWE